ncbi:flagellar basal body P-ring formation chaperone FlgA [Rhodohalobacter sp. 8-1]|uniref:flagellar basal body P-ring formation chaperone FlgA n=1 Tax=Rhodohalobacter sp. 8-1 TaxID=3131972 RepID=UPI0030EDD6BD
MILIIMMTLSLLGGQSPAEPHISPQTPDAAHTWQFERTDLDIADTPSAQKTGGETREVIIRKALNALNTSHDSDAYRFSVTPRWIPGSLERVDAAKITSVEPEGNVERYTNFTVTYRERGRTQTANVQLMVETERMLPVATQRIMSGDILENRSLEMRWVSVPYDRGQLVEQINEIEGKTLRRTLSDGQPIRYADISSDYLVEAGDTVEMIYEQNGLRIVIEGEARQSGAQDDEITIYNKETRKRYVGKVSSPGVVLWKGTL